MKMGTKHILLLVEGEKTEPKLIHKILNCYPEMDIPSDNIIVFGTDIYFLYTSMVNQFGENFFSQDIDFLGFLNSLETKPNSINLYERKITDIYLIFDYERRATLFDEKIIFEMLGFFHESTENGKLYINYPMIESFKHINVKTFPDPDYKERKCSVPLLGEYKKIVGEESKHANLKNYDRTFFNEIVKINIKKANYMINQEFDLADSDLIHCYRQIDFNKILSLQNKSSADSQNGYIYVLCTCIFIIMDYNTMLVFT